MTIQQYDWVKLKDGQLAAIVEVFSDKDFLADIGSGPEDWDTIPVTIDNIEKVYGPDYKSTKESQGMTYEEILQDLDEFKLKKEAYQRGEINDGMSDECRQNWIDKCNS